ncbi:DUF4124 domain-containing protein [Polaromonas sp. YR568]|uniref:DUF4124 domain-containing protein n=1 Tax=Polaromonas sp. YR568 TaxID=1855301 RepID=UPI00398C056C
MRHAFRPALVASSLALLFMQHAGAQVYQCLDKTGKKVFSQMPCAAQGGNDETLIMRAPAGAAPVKSEPGALYGNSGAAPAPKDWAAENAAANARAMAPEISGGGSRQAPSALGGLRKSTPTGAGATNQQIIANCEANHGARCNSPGEIAQRRMEQRELSPAERQQQQNAVAARRQREQEEAFNRSTRR